MSRPAIKPYIPRYVRLKPNAVLAAILSGETTGRVVRTTPEWIGTVVVEFDADHIFRVKVDEV